MYGFYSLPLASSVTDVDQIRYSFPNDISEPYNLTVTCIIHPDSIAEQCVVRARVNESSVTRASK